MQASLFQLAPATLLDDAEGGVSYWPEVVAPEQASAWFQALHAGIAWHTEQRPMYDHTVDVPRLMATHALHQPGTPPVLQAALAALQGGVSGLDQVPFSHVGLNLYRDGRDSVALHNDRLHNLAPGQPIVLLSLGAERTLLLRPKRGGPSRRVALAPGSVVVMSHASQRTHDHGIPKTTAPVGPRISLAFRVRSAAEVNAR